jgi:hypothetical protein
MSSNNQGSGFYESIALLVGVITFLACWLYAITTSGFIIGVVIGWLPDLIVAFIAGALWPILAILILIIWRLSTH